MLCALDANHSPQSTSKAKRKKLIEDWSDRMARRSEYLTNAVKWQIAYQETPLWMN
jgi:hypothetical protein